MSCYESFGLTHCSEKREHEIDAALDVINENKLRICCMHCLKEIVIEITKKQYEALKKFLKEL